MPGVGGLVVVVVVGEVGIVGEVVIMGEVVDEARWW